MSVFPVVLATSLLTFFRGRPLGLPVRVMSLVPKTVNDGAELDGEVRTVSSLDLNFFFPSSLFNFPLKEAGSPFGWS